jgi:O-antigen/teichoic acid export membrane protein
MKYSDDLKKQGSLMFVAVTIFNIFHLLYQLYMVRNLSPIDYGVLNSLFSILMIVSIPSGTLQTVVTKFIATFHATNHPEKIGFLLRSFVKKIAVISLVVSLILILGSRGISSFLQITSPLLVVTLGIITFFSIILPLTQGGLQGLQRFGYLGLTMITNSGLKLLLGVLFVSIGFRVLGAIGALAISTFFALLLSFSILTVVLPRPLLLIPESLQLESNNPDPEINFSEIYRYFYPVITVFFCFMILTNIDVVLVKHFFKPLEAGYYSIAQMVGKIILFLPVAITMVIFPKASKLHTQGKDTSHFLKKGLLYIGAVCGTGALICFLFPDLIIKLLTGKENLHCIPLVRIFSVAMTFFALVYLLLFYHLSIHRLDFIYSLVLLTLLHIIGIILFHESLSQVLYIMCGNGILLFFINVYLAFKRKETHGVSGVSSNS